MSEIRMVAQMYREGRKTKEIAKMLGRTVFSVEGCLKTLKDKNVIQRKTHKWTKKDYAAIRRMRQEGHSAKEIATALNIREELILKKLFLLGFHKNRRWTTEDLAILRQMITERKTDKEIAKRLNRSLRAVKSKRYELGLQKSEATKKQKWTIEELRRLRQIRAEGATITTAAIVLNRTRESVLYGWSLVKQNRNNGLS